MPVEPTVVCLVGMPGSGKSTIAPILAARLGCECRDLDVVITEAAGMAADAIFEAEGEAGFRRRELDALTQALQVSKDLVVSTGAGVVTCDAALDLLGRATCVWLRSGLASLAERIVRSDQVRPLLAGDLRARLADLDSARAPRYRSVSAIVVDVDDLDPEAVVDAIVEELT